MYHNGHKGQSSRKYGGLKDSFSEDMIKLYDIACLKVDQIL